MITMEPKWDFQSLSWVLYDLGNISAVLNLGRYQLLALNDVLQVSRGVRITTAHGPTYMPPTNTNTGLFL